MNWRVTYRAGDGRQAADVFEAETREALFKALAAKGISTIRIEESNGKTASRGGRERNRGVPIALAGMGLLALGIGVFAFLRQTEKPKPPANVRDRPSRISEDKPTATLDSAKASTAARPDNGISTSQDDGIPPGKRIVEMVSVVTNADGSVLERFRTADGKTRSRQSAPKPVFDNASDQLLAAAVGGAASGASMPPMPMMDNAEEEFEKSLEKEIVINDDDSPDVKALKRSVIALREEMRRLLDAGNSFADVLRDHRDIVNHGVEMRREATRLISEFVDAGDEESARASLEKVNATLTQMGIEEVEMPLTRAERREVIGERHRNKK